MVAEQLFPGAPTHHESDRFEEIKREFSRDKLLTAGDEKWLIAEVERLRNAVVDHTIRCDRIISESREEVERLRAELAAAQKRIAEARTVIMSMCGGDTTAVLKWLEGKP